MLREFPIRRMTNQAGQADRSCAGWRRLSRLTEVQVVEHILTASRAGRGGWVATPNIDICRQTQHDEALHRLVASASLIVPDGMPLIWAARLVREPLPERVTGASLIFSLTQAAARQQRSIYLLGGAPGVPERAGEELRRRYPGLVVAGTDAPPVGFDADPQAVSRQCAPVSRRRRPTSCTWDSDSPSRNASSRAWHPPFPATWFVSCGAAIPFAANALPRAPLWMQSAGLEWVFRLISEPRRLYRRYLLHDLPFAVRLLAVSAMHPFRRTGRHARVNTLKHRPLGAKSQLTEMLQSPVPDITAERREVQITPRHFQAEPLPVPPSLIPPGQLAASGAARRQAILAHPLDGLTVATPE